MHCLLYLELKHTRVQRTCTRQQQHMHKTNKQADEIGKATFKFAFLLDTDEEERERTLDAMHAVYKYSTAEGQSKFGSIKFKDIAYFVSKHLKGSASIECDSWHDGAGYLNHHVAFTLEFEQAIQAADPAVSLPYWDFTLDAHRQTYVFSILHHHISPELIWSAFFLAFDACVSWVRIDTMTSTGSRVKCSATTGSVRPRQCAAITLWMVRGAGLSRHGRGSAELAGGA